MKEYKGVKTESISHKVIYYREKNHDRKWWQLWKPSKITKSRMGDEVRSVYYEKAFDRDGVGINLGNMVKVVSVENNPPESLNNTYRVRSIFQGDLMLGDKSFYCWPRNVVLVERN